MGPTPFYGARAEKTQKADFAMKQTNICRLSGDIMMTKNRKIMNECVHDLRVLRFVSCELPVGVDVRNFDETTLLKGDTR